ncbi:hypothetical protein NC651_036704 [Populus alba x Populus x berolinensis]|nr:hypothetical protein NC651_036704 [Populus alba x Populus x berolinensis]
MKFGVILSWNSRPHNLKSIHRQWKRTGGACENKLRGGKEVSGGRKSTTRGLLAQEAKNHQHNENSAHHLLNTVPCVYC